MKFNKVFNILLCFIIVFVSIPFNTYANDIYDEIEYASGEIVLITDDELKDTSSDSVVSDNSDYTLIDFEEEEIQNAEEINTYNDTSDEKAYLIEIEGDVSKKCQELKKLPGIKYAEPNIIFHTSDFTIPQEITNGTYYNEKMKWYFDLMQIPQTWQEFETNGEGIVVAVIDNGFDINAADFSQKLWSDEDGNHGWNTYTNTADISPIYKKDGTAFGNTKHGTHVAGVIGANADGKNCIGAAYGAELMLINAAHYVSETTAPSFRLDDIIEAIDFARENNADVINLSLNADAISDALEAAVNRAYNAGIVVVAAAGNEGASASVIKSIPSSYKNVIGVMASDITNRSELAYFSNYDPTGLYYDVAVPGCSILSCTTELNKVETISGTSQAAPLVASCAALYMSVYKDATVKEVYDAIRNSPTTLIKSNSKVVTDTTYYFDFLNAYEMLSYGITYGKPEPEFNLNLETTVTHDPNLKYIYGLDEGFTDISQYLTVTDGTGTLVFKPTENGNGTGSTIEIYDIDGILYDTYTIIIFGDTNGDSYSDGQDAVIISWILDSPDNFSEPVKYAADVDFNNVVEYSDYSITANYAVGMDFMFQIR